MSLSSPVKKGSRIRIRGRSVTVKETMFEKFIVLTVEGQEIVVPTYTIRAVEEAFESGESEIRPNSPCVLM